MIVAVTDLAHLVIDWQSDQMTLVSTSTLCPTSVKGSQGPATVGESPVVSLTWTGRLVENTYRLVNALSV